MSLTLVVKIDLDTKRRLDAISKRSKRSAAVLASQAIMEFVDSEEWQSREIQAGLEDLESGRHVDDAKVSKWLRSWGTEHETRPPR